MANSEFKTILAEIDALLSRLDDDEINRLIQQLVKARRIVVTGAGRERLQLMGLAMRMHHLGMAVAVAGDMTTPPVETDDLLLATCGPGELSTISALAQKAKQAGADVAIITAQPDGTTVALADFVLTVPAQTMADDQGGSATSMLPMGSLFEAALLMLFEVLALRLQDTLNVSPQDMRSNHTNLE